MEKLFIQLLSIVVIENIEVDLSKEQILSEMNKLIQYRKDVQMYEGLEEWINDTANNSTIMSIIENPDLKKTMSGKLETLAIALNDPIYLEATTNEFIKFLEENK